MATNRYDFQMPPEKEKILFDLAEYYKLDQNTTIWQVIKMMVRNLGVLPQKITITGEFYNLKQKEVQK